MIHADRTLLYTQQLFAASFSHLSDTPLFAFALQGITWLLNHSGESSGHFQVIPIDLNKYVQLHNRVRAAAHSSSYNSTALADNTLPQNHVYICSGEVFTCAAE